MYPLFFFFNDTASPDIYTLSLHDALPISRLLPLRGARRGGAPGAGRRLVGARRARRGAPRARRRDRESTRLNSSHANISYAVFCLQNTNHTTIPYSVFCSTTKYIASTAMC